MRWSKNQSRFSVSSPDGRTRFEVWLRAGHLSYRVVQVGATAPGSAPKPAGHYLTNSKINSDAELEIIGESGLGLRLQGEAPLQSNLAVVRVNRRSFDETWETAWGEERKIRNHYNELAVYLTEVKEPHRLFTVRVRVFDDGVAFRYELPVQPKFRRVIVTEELTEFKLPPTSYAWQIPAYQPDRYEYNYERTALYDLRGSVHTPLTVELPNGKFVSLHEAALYDYGAMTLKLNEWHNLQADVTPLAGRAKAYVDLPFATPWRLAMIADSPLALTTNRIMLNLNEPPQRDFSWVEPLKFLGIWWAMYVGEWTWAPGEKHGATTEHALEYIEACGRLGVKGLLMEGWNNGWEGDWLENGAHSDFLHPMPDLDLPKVAQAARAKGVEIVGHHETVGFVDNYERQIEAAYKYCADNGIHYIKPGYSGKMMEIQGRKEFHHSQLGVQHYQKALELAAKYHICLDVHEPIKGTGIERTWPNLLSREGARGQEYEGGSLLPSHACILPFTRLLSGGMDYTSGIFDLLNGKKRVFTTLARQLAYYVTIFSGMQMAADRPFVYEKSPETWEFIHEVPVSWERTAPLAGAIGEYYVVARQERGGEAWYVGGVTNENARDLTLDFSFLDLGKIYQATLWRDGANAHYRDNPLDLEIEKFALRTGEQRVIHLAPGGGFALKLLPK